jgi:exonuclease SbcC
MIPVHLSLSGFLSYLDPVDLDFTTFEVACISGSNGAGKSSLLDAITWVLFGQARRRDDTIINSSAKTAEVTLDMQYEGHLYRVQRIKTRDKAVVLEFFVCTPEGDWRALTEHSMRETEQRIQQTLRMDYETFVNASFFLQGKADSFAQQRPGDRKKILSSILGLEVWETYRNNAAERRKRMESDVAAVDSVLDEINKELSEEDQRKARLKDLEDSLAQYQSLRQTKEASLETLRRLAASLEEQRRLVRMLESQLQAARQRLADHTAQREARLAEQTTYAQQLAREEEVKAAYARWQEARKDLERWEEVAANFRQHDQQRSAPLMAIRAERSRLEQELQTLQAQEHAIRQGAERLPVLEQQIQETDASLNTLAAQLNERPAVENSLRALHTEGGEAQAENRRLRDLMNELRERIDQLRQIEGALCPLCGQPLNAAEREKLIDSLEGEGREMADRYRQNQKFMQESESRRQEMEARLTGFTPMENELRRLHRLADQLDDQLQQARTSLDGWEAGGALRLSQVRALLEQETYAPEAHAELERINAALKELGYDAAAHDAVRRAEQEGRTSEEGLRQLEAARAALAPVEREIQRLDEQLQSDTTEVATQEAATRSATEQYQAGAASLPDLNVVEKELFALQEDENRARMQVGGARQAVQVLDMLRKRQKEQNQRRVVLTRQVSQLKVLERAFGKDGVPALLIEQALPEIETQANEILDRLSGGNMAVRFSTQKDYKDKSRDDKRETLDIIISDAIGSREYELFSGGEAFRVNFAIRLALSRFLSQRAGARLQTLVIDEGFGSQDAEGRQRLIEAINMVRPDFEKILAITHLEELKEAFPVRIEVEKTPRGSQVRVIG